MPHPRPPPGEHMHWGNVVVERITFWPHAWGDRWGIVRPRLTIIEGGYRTRSRVKGLNIGLSVTPYFLD